METETFAIDFSCVLVHYNDKERKKEGKGKGGQR